MVAETPTDHQTPSFAPPAGVVVPIVPEFSAFDVHALSWVDRGWEVLPISPDLARGKVLLAAGITGYGGEPWTADEVRQAVAGDLTYIRPDHPKGPTLVHPWQPNRNLALRMPPGVVGLDVDAYEGKTGGHTLRELEDKAGVALPVTWVLTARDDGSRSGIRLFRIPPDTKLADQTDIEMIQRHHRYAMATGSLHKTGRRVRLLRSDTWAESPVIPEPSELPLLPAAWVKLLKAKDQTREFGGVTIQPEEAVQAWLDDHPHGVGWTKADAERAYERAWGAYGSRNTSQFVALAEALRAARDGKVSAADAIAWIAEAHHRACADDGSRADRNDEEISRSVAKIVSKFLGEQITAIPAVAPKAIQAIEIQNSQHASEWLLSTLGTGKMSGFFLKDGQLVHCVRYGEDGFTEVSNGHQDYQQIKPVSTDDIMAFLTTSYHFAKYDGRSQSHKLSLFPREAAGIAVAGTYAAPGLKTLRGVTTTPIVRRDGSILDRAGFDPSTGLLYEPDNGMEQVRVSESPSAEELANARQWIDILIKDFPFSTPDDRINYVAFLLTPLLRVALPGPRKLFVMDARQPGTGKTLLAEITHMIHGGVMRGPLAADDAEVQKDIATILTGTASPVVTFDNVEGLLKSTHLTSLLTNLSPSFRVLGSLTNVALTNDRVWSITGNNVAIGGDFARRCIFVDIDYGKPNPEGRTGLLNLHTFIPQNRPAILWALLTMIRAWQAAGASGGEPKGSDAYGEWLGACQGICSYAGYQGTVGGGNREAALSTDDDEWCTFLTALYDTFGAGATFTAKDVLAASQPYASGDGVRFPETALPGPILDKRNQTASAAKSLGRWLLNRKGRWAGGYRVVQSGQDRTRIAQWRVEKYA